MSVEQLGQLIQLLDLFLECAPLSKHEGANVEQVLLYAHSVHDELRLKEGDSRAHRA